MEMHQESVIDSFYIHVNVCACACACIYAYKYISLLQRENVNDLSQYQCTYGAASY